MNEHDSRPHASATSAETSSADAAAVNTGGLLITHAVAAAAALPTDGILETAATADLPVTCKAASRRVAMLAKVRNRVGTTHHLQTQLMSSLHE